jgi:S-adenosylmethionine uptake transporter
MMIKSATTTRNYKYFYAIFWVVLSTAFSNFNDVLTRFMGERLHEYEIAWFRFLFSALVLLPFMLYYGKKSFQTSNIFVHAIRGVLLFAAILCWTMGVVSEGIHLTLVTTISFTVPIFVIVLAYFILREKIPSRRWIATLAGFAGMVVSIGTLEADFNYRSLFLIGSALMFASLDIINKLLVVKESMLAMLFYSAIFTTLIGLWPAMLHWQTPTYMELFWLLCLGIGANLVLYFLLKAFALADVSALAPFKYTELLFSMMFGYFLFMEVPKYSTLLGCSIIIPATLYLAYTESKARK